MEHWNWSNGEERIIQIAAKPGDTDEYSSLFVLTNLGRIFQLSGDTWHKIELPDFSQLDEGPR